MSAFTHGVQLLQQLSDKRGVPFGMHLQVADRCNHSCAHCYQVQGLKGELSLDEVRGVIDQLADAGVLTLNVSGGEATLRPDLLEILSHARSRGFALRLYTNAFLVDDAMADRLAAVGLHEVHVSVYSTLAEEHDAVTRVPGSWERTLRGVKALRARDVRVVLKTPVVSLARKGARHVAALARSLGCAYSAGSELTAMEDGGLDPLALRADGEQLAEAGLIKGWKPSEADVAVRDEKLSHHACGVGRTGMVVLPNGDVLPCTDTPAVIGNVARDAFRTVLEGAPEMGLFKSLTLRQVHGCRDCDLLPACKRCHATALHQGGDYLGPYAGGCARARDRYALGLGRPVELLEPDPGCAPGREATVGPYRIEAEGSLRPVADVITDEDDALARRFPWLRRAKDRGAEHTPAPPQVLVPLRRKRVTPA